MPAASAAFAEMRGSAVSSGIVKNAFVPCKSHIDFQAASGPTLWRKPFLWLWLRPMPRPQCKCIVFDRDVCQELANDILQALAICTASAFQRIADLFLEGSFHMSSSTVKPFIGAYTGCSCARPMPYAWRHSSEKLPESWIKPRP